MHPFAAEPVPEVGPEEALRLLESDNALLLDVREDDEWQAGHAEAAVHVPLGRLGAEAGGLPRDRRIVAVCRMGGRSERATRALRGAGWDAVNLAGGMQAWEAAGQAVVTDDASPGQVI